MSDLRKVVIDDTEIEVDGSMTLIQACEEAGIEIPRFCYHERLSIAGNCRMCLVEVKGGPPKPQASCAMNVRDLRPGPNGEPPEIFLTSKINAPRCSQMWRTSLFEVTGSRSTTSTHWPLSSLTILPPGRSARAGWLNIALTRKQVATIQHH